MRRDGYIDRFTEEGIEIAVVNALGHIDGLAIVPRSLFPPEDHERMRRGSYIECDVDDTLLVTAIRLKPMPQWTEDELAEARAKAIERMRSIRFE
jgi:hypothetical protein